MESPPSVEETVACIANLYHNPNAEEKSQANQWLQILQNSVFAWKVRRDLLVEKKFGVKKNLTVLLVLKDAAVVICTYQMSSLKIFL